jgi:hypothetical protein
VAHIAWHEWGHALSLARCSPDNVAAGGKLLTLAPEGLSDGIRSAGYGAKSYTHAVIVETYALMMTGWIDYASGRLLPRERPSSRGCSSVSS